MTDTPEELKPISAEEAIRRMAIPDQYFYANSVRVYSGAGDCLIEFGRALPPPGVNEQTSVPVAGVAVPAIVAVQLARQLLQQAQMLAPQMKEMADDILNRLPK